MKRNGRYQHTKGYILIHIPVHPDADGNGCVLEHRLVMEQVIGRRLLHSGHVHHINGDRRDNDPENLELLTASEHAVIANKQLDKAALMRKHRWPIGYTAKTNKQENPAHPFYGSQYTKTTDGKLGNGDDASWGCEL